MHSWCRSPKAIVLALAVFLVAAVACGTSAEPQIIEKEVIVEKEVIREVPVEKQVVVEKEVIREVIKEVPVVKEVIKEIPKEVTIDRIVVATPTPIPAQAQKVEAKVGRVIYAFGEVVETNRHWSVSRPSYYQFDPWAETMVGLDPKTNERTRRLAKEWEWSPNGKEWTFHLEEGVQFQHGFGEFTSKDVLHALERQQWPDS